MPLYDLEHDDWKKFLSDQPSFRADQIWKAIHENALRPEYLTSLPKDLRERISTCSETTSALEVLQILSDPAKTTEKALFRLKDGNVIETVLMHYPERSTVCISSQAGCAMNCGFCATGQQGFARHLSVGEIVEQVIWAIQRTKVTRGEKRLTNIVFMGMGEPLANTRRVFPAIRRINSAIGIGARHITVSTVGVIPGIRAFAKLGLQVNLAVSLHAANDEKRSSLVPINDRYPICSLMDSLESYIAETKRRVSFEWAMLEGINDTDRDATELISHCVRLGAHVNLIPLNPTPGWPAVGSSTKRVHEFALILEDAGIAVSIRDNRGTDIDAACGQLAATMPIREIGTRIEQGKSATNKNADLFD